jgi:hypothetical protein
MRLLRNQNCQQPTVILVRLLCLFTLFEALDVESGMIKLQITAQFPEARIDLPLLPLANVHSANIFPHGCLI